MCSDNWQQEQVQDQAEVSPSLPSAPVWLEISPSVITALRLPNIYSGFVFPFNTCSTITLVGAKKRKRNASSDHSDGEISPASPVALEDDLIMVQAHTRIS